MFFGSDESPFVSHFVEFTERVGRSSSFSSSSSSSLSSSSRLGGADEDARAAAASALRGMAPIFRRRRVSDLPPVMRYGFVNAANAGLVLLSDEEEDVRSEAAAFVCALMEARGGGGGGDGESVSLPTALAAEALVHFGMEEFGDCVGWFEPVVDVLLVPWRDDGMAELDKSLKRFGKGREKRRLSTALLLTSSFIALGKQIMNLTIC